MSKLISYTVVLGAIAMSINSAKAGNHVEWVQCPEKKSAIGMTLGVPETYWERRGDFFICLMCETPKQIEDSRKRDDEESEEERAMREIKNKFSLEACSFYGESTKTMVQRFDCVDSQYLSGFRKENGSLSSSLMCSGLTKESSKNASVYESSFPNRGILRIRNNWQKWDINLDCREEGKYLCGIETKIFEEFNQPPTLSPVCCKAQRKGGKAHAFSSPLSVSSAATAWIVVLVILVILLAAIAIVCCVNVWCCRILSADCSPSSDEESYFTRKNGENGENGDTPSQFNTRPNTAAANGRASKMKRPMTSTVRKSSSQVDVIA